VSDSLAVAVAAREQLIQNWLLEYMCEERLKSRYEENQGDKWE